MSSINFDGGDFLWLWLTLAAAAMIVVVLLYRYERQLVAARVGHCLLALRLSAIGVLFLALTQPVLTRSRDNQQSMQLVIALDVSDSMRTSDPHAEVQQKQRWADTLELPRDPDSTALIGELSRLELAVRLLTSTSQPLLDSLKSLGEVRAKLFAGTSLTADRDAIASVVETPPENFSTELTDLAVGLTTTEADSAQDAAISAIVLFSDGRDNGEGKALNVARELGERGIHVFPVALGSEEQPTDIVLAGLDVPDVVFQGDTPRLHVTLGTHGFEGKQIEVVLQGESGEPVRRTVTPDGPTSEVVFDLEANQAGRAVYNVTAAEQPGEVRDDNNAREFALTVIDDTVRVLLLEGEARWEFRFIDNAFNRDSRVDVSPVVFEQPFLNVLDENFFARKLDIPDDPAAWDTSLLAEMDLVIVGDVPAQYLSPTTWQALENYVDEGRGTLMFLAGKNHLPLGFDSDILKRLLPLTDIREIHRTDDRSKSAPPARGFHLQLTAEGKREPMLQFVDDREKNRETWRDFAGHLWALVGRAKPGATVLATVSPDEKTDKLAPISNRDDAVLVLQPYGLGRVLWLGIDSTWRWRYRAGDRYHHRFWGQVARFAAHNRGGDGTGAVKFGPTHGEFQAGDDVVLRARFSRLLLERHPTLKATAEIFRAEDIQYQKPVGRVLLAPASSRPLAHEGRLAGLQQGEYVAKLNVAGAGLDDKQWLSPIYVAKQQTSELTDVTANVELLREIAAASGGQLLFPDELAQLPALLQSPSDSSVEVQETRLWDHWLVLALFCALVTTEWGVRKWHGLP